MPAHDAIDAIKSSASTICTGMLASRIRRMTENSLFMLAAHSRVWAENAAAGPRSRLADGAAHHAAESDHRDSHPVRDHSGYFEIVAGLGAVGVNRVDTQFAGAQTLALARPFKRVAPGSAFVRRR